MNDSQDIKNFNSLFENYFQRFVQFAYSYVKETKVAEDITMEAFMSFWENRERLVPETNPPAYILTIIKNKCISHLRHMQTHNLVVNKLSEHYAWKLNLQISTLEACNPEQIFSAEVQAIIHDVLKNLPERTVEIFRLSRYDKLSHKAIAEQLNISTKGVEFHISKALKAMRIALKDYHPSIIILILTHFFHIIR